MGHECLVSFVQLGNGCIDGSSGRHAVVYHVAGFIYALVEFVDGFLSVNVAYTVVFFTDNGRLNITFVLLDKVAKFLGIGIQAFQFHNSLFKTYVDGTVGRVIKVDGGCFVHQCFQCFASFFHAFDVFGLRLVELLIHLPFAYVPGNTGNVGIGKLTVGLCTLHGRVLDNKTHILEGFAAFELQVR